MTSVHIEAVFCRAKSVKLGLIPRPLVCDNVSTTHAPDGNNHFGDLLSGFAMESNFNLRFGHGMGNRGLGQRASAFIGTVKEDAVLSENVICS